MLKFLALNLKINGGVVKVLLIYEFGPIMQIECLTLTTVVKLIN